MSIHLLSEVGRLKIADEGEKADLVVNDGDGLGGLVYSQGKGYVWLAQVRLGELTALSLSSLSYLYDVASVAQDISMAVDKRLGLSIMVAF